MTLAKQALDPVIAERIATARAAKVLRYVDYFDRVARALGEDPDGNAAAMVEALRSKTSQLAWRQHAVCAGQNRASLDTQDAIIAVYAARAGQHLRLVP